MENREIEKECYECSSRNTRIENNTLKCNECGGRFVHKSGVKNE